MIKLRFGQLDNNVLLTFVISPNAALLLLPATVVVAWIFFKPRVWRWTSFPGFIPFMTLPACLRSLFCRPRPLEMEVEDFCLDARGMAMQSFYALLLVYLNIAKNRNESSFFSCKILRVNVLLKGLVQRYLRKTNDEVRGRSVGRSGERVSEQTRQRGSADRKRSLGGWVSRKFLMDILVYIHVYNEPLAPG